MYVSYWKRRHGLPSIDHKLFGNAAEKRQDNWTSIHSTLQYWQRLSLSIALHMGVEDNYHDNVGICRFVGKIRNQLFSADIILLNVCLWQTEYYREYVEHACVFFPVDIRRANI